MPPVIARTRQLAGIEPLPEDAKIVAAIETLPQPPRGASEVIFQCGVVNGLGAVYRVVDHRSDLELLYFIARMNALGFRKDEAARNRFRNYLVVFSKPPRRAAPEAFLLQI